MTEERVFWVRLSLQAIASVATAVAAGAVSFDYLGSVANHDLAAICTLCATACNTVLLGLATLKDATNRPAP